MSFAECEENGHKIMPRVVVLLTILTYDQENWGGGGEGRVDLINVKYIYNIIFKKNYKSITLRKFILLGD